jgi:hypothetical protein
MPLPITDQLLKRESFLPERHPKKQIFIHHTAGSHNPVNVIQGWDVDTRGRVATAFVIGGRSSKGADDSFNGKVYRAFDENCWAYHLGLAKSALDKSSIGIEICNFGDVSCTSVYTGYAVPGLYLLPHLFNAAA